MWETSRAEPEVSNSSEPRPRRWPFKNLFLPGLAQLKAGERLKGVLYLLLGLATAGLAYGTNRFVYLRLYWRFKELELPSTFLRSEFYSSKYSSLYAFVWIYLIVGLVSAIDFKWSRPPRGA